MKSETVPAAGKEILIISKMVALGKQSVVLTSFHREMWSGCLPGLPVFEPRTPILPWGTWKPMDTEGGDLG